MATVENHEDLLSHAVEIAERKKARNKVYYEEHKEEIAEYQKKYYREHMAYYSDYNRRYRQANRKKFRNYMRARRNKERFENQFELPLSFASGGVK